MSTPWAESAFLAILIANLFQGCFSLFWLAGLKRVFRPLPPALYAELLQFSLILPVALGLLRLLGLEPTRPGMPLVRIEKWAEALATSGPLPKAVFFTILGGTMAIFVFQELVPLFAMLKGRTLGDEKPDPELGVLLTKVNSWYRQAGILKDRSRQLKTVYRITLDTPLAALHGLMSPTLVVSDLLVRKLDPPELEGVVAHEVAHLHYGGNLRLLITWLIRAVQAFNPISLILFRELIEARELACDALAARVTAKPSILAAALLKFEEQPSMPPSDQEVDQISQARQELRERGEAEATRVRVEALAGDKPIYGPTPPVLRWLVFVIFGGLLWLLV